MFWDYRMNGTFEREEKRDLEEFDIMERALSSAGMFFMKLKDPFRISAEPVIMLLTEYIATSETGIAPGPDFAELCSSLVNSFPQ
jgi:hypothetical protein